MRIVSHTFLIALLPLWSLLLLTACAPEEEKAREPSILARVGNVEITDIACEQVVDRLHASGNPAVTAEERRQRFQLLVDRELLLLEARELKLDEDPRVREEIQAWERARLIEALLQAEMGPQLTWDEEELKSFFTEIGAGQEIRLSRLVLDDRARAVDALQKVRGGESIDQLVKAYSRPEQLYRHGDLGWLNPLTMSNPKLSFLFQMEEGAVELIEGEELYFLMAITGKRQVALEECRVAVEAALERKKRHEANLAYLEYLTSHYAVSLDNAGLKHLLEAASLEQVNRSMRLVQSKLGEWAVGDYLQGTETLVDGKTRLPDTAPALGFHITRAYIVTQLLVEEARQKGLYAAIEEKRRDVHQQKLIEALWRRQGVDAVPFTEAEFDAFYEANKDRYESEKGTFHPTEWRNRIAQDLREAKAAPLFEEYLAQLRQRRASTVSVDEKRLGEFVALGE